ncbi:Fpg/Nei family DNA glycosylase [Microbacterium imperiale]|uniref:DNA-(apurinic or apyrimidinic site) lyase n=1 Tax=Microbacterium imperiale TaxID=33884 RepID=A0A9W6HHC7_9MICO|nr:Fpg/Nei family DNA glycosylase [Microbacterium imperiale]MBP2420644.1 endonuclease-8 [Microbacterium imperiale]MDS0200465.1 Fpg/Nei family DNA glycosylase [Microbacterium imperiale]BFE40984.1 Fpg/Nei family DNA glycosylase [Microbacterium imperiale]GLJ80049.1 putative endonuclease 8 2 [Microbacterium imperiale]
MPEGDTVFRAARTIGDALVGHEVTRFDIRVPGSATADLRGERVHSSIARGKHLLLRVGEHTLHSHLKMEGRWHVYRPGQRWRAPAFQARAIVGTAPADAVGFELAMVEVLPTADEDRLVGHLGPDLLGPDWDLAEASRRVAADTRAAHVALLDQRNVAGLGNVYANELLFVRGILPTTPANEIDATAVLETGYRMIQANRDRSARTFTGIDRPGQRMWVYRREGKPCRRCGTLIETDEIGALPTSERLIFWCPRCQS